ncbi:hypothetical protein [Hymenobacter chitinivorans]|uniref:Uncharacterized protein n=1 Tax=Hymenobacter chitinivorans DSM 11115 TaxID=1121954 RepID=A0A2M9BR84_9BACT|nr:hypothetical protein [Hymenobacter chitinivorans]PJJ60461.1 hypothetical protein CLV45_1888 [Hymenobacter chitinivorans DSM 11115]
MNKVLLLIGVVLFLLTGGPAEAARPSAYARAKARGRVFVHRPNYKLYRGAKRHRSKKVFHLPGLSRKAGGSRSRF